MSETQNNDPKKTPPPKGRAKNPLADACVPLMDVPAKLRSIWGIKQKR